jgi:hypothetical protein
VARRPKLGRLDDSRIAVLDERAYRTSRSDLIREATDVLHGSGEDAAIEAGCERHPPGEIDVFNEQAAEASIRGDLRSW